MNQHPMVTRHGVKRALVALAHRVEHVDVLQPLSVRLDVIEDIMEEYTRIEDILSSHPVLQLREDLQQLLWQVMFAYGAKLLKLVDDILNA